MNEPLTPSVGWGVLHLFCHIGASASAVDAQAIAGAVKEGEADGLQVVPFSVFGHKADLGFMAIDADWVRLRRFQAAVQAAGLVVADSYLSLTELSEYAGDLPPERAEARLHPHLPPDGKRAFCFYPMTKRRGEVHNWYTQDFERRRELMMDHGRSGRRFAGRIVQLITGSTGLDDFEWGVTLFGEHPDDLKETVYTMRYDEASALYGEFGAFYAGIVGTIDEVLGHVGLAG